MTEKIRILMVDDNPYDVEIVRALLRQYPRAQFELQSVESTARCTEVLEHGPFDLILLDQNLPGEDGLSLLRRLGARADIPPIIMLTGDGDERLAAEAMRCGAYDYFPKRSINSIVLARAIHQALEKFELDQQLEHTEQVIFTLATAVEAKDPTTGEHLQRITHYAIRLGQALGLDRHRLLLLRYGAILHDIGKIAVSEAILCKPGPLNDAEWGQMRQHPIIGEKICASLRYASEVGPILRHHHERWDGKGYVDSLSGDQIPFLARVISVVDAYDAMTSDRPYRKMMMQEEAVTVLREGAGSQWDPDITGVLLDLVQRERLSKWEPTKATAL